MHGIKPGAYRLINLDTGEEYRMHIGAFNVFYDVRLEYQCPDILPGLKPKQLQEAATTPNQLQEVSHATE